MIRTKHNDLSSELRIRNFEVIQDFMSFRQTWSFTNCSISSGFLMHILKWFISFSPFENENIDFFKKVNIVFLINLIKVNSKVITFISGHINYGGVQKQMNEKHWTQKTTDTYVNLVQMFGNW